MKTCSNCVYFSSFYGICTLPECPTVKSAISKGCNQHVDSRVEVNHYVKYKDKERKK